MSDIPKRGQTAGSQSVGHAESGTGAARQRRGGLGLWAAAIIAALIIAGIVVWLVFAN